MVVYFATGNANKAREAETILNTAVEQVQVDTAEIQHRDMEEVVQGKLRAAMNHTGKRPLLVDDTGLGFNGLNGLPGPFIKWFLEELGPRGLYELAAASGDTAARVTCVVGYADEHNDIHTFTGVVNGDIVAPRGTTEFGWDPVFQPDGYEKTYAEMREEEKNQVSHRREALNKVRAHL